MKPLRFDSNNVGCVFSGVKSFWEEDVRDFVLKNVRRQLEGMLRVGDHNLSRLELYILRFCRPSWLAIPDQPGGVFFSVSFIVYCHRSA